MSPPNGVPATGEKIYLAVSNVDPSDGGAEAEEETKDRTRDNLRNEKCAAEPTLSKTLEPCDLETEIVVPPDGGWGWVVVAGSFMCNMIVDGIIFSFGMFLKVIGDTFEVSSAQVSLVGSLLSGFYLMAGPFASALANRYGFRFVAILGCIMSAVAFVLSYFATSVTFLCITYGIMGGIGFGLIYVPSVITVGFYFERWRALATGIGVCGSGIGAFLFAPLSAKVIEMFGWRKALFVQAAIVLSCIFAGILFRPLKPKKVKELEMDEVNQLNNDEKKTPLLQRTKIEEEGDDKNSKFVSTESVNNGNDGGATTSDIPKSNKRLSVPIIVTTTGDDQSKSNNGTAPLLNMVASTPVITSNRRKSLSDKRQRTDSESRSRKSTLTGGEVNRPLYRDDIFFGASLTRLPQYTSQSSIAYNMSVTKLPTKTEIEEEQSKECKCCPEAVHRTLSTMLDFNLFKSPSFLLLAISGGFTMMGFYVPFMFLVERAKASGMEHNASIWLISTIGIANTIGRVLCGIFSSFPRVNALFVTNAALTMGGIATIFSGLSMTDEFQFTYSVLFGLAISCFASLRSIVTVDLLGLENLTNAFGLLCLFQGIAAAVGSPLAGAFKDATGNYDASFYLSGSLILASAIMCYPLNAINRWEKRKASKLSMEKKSVPV